MPRFLPPPTPPNSSLPTDLVLFCTDAISTPYLHATNDRTDVVGECLCVSVCVCVSVCLCVCVCLCLCAILQLILNRRLSLSLSLLCREVDDARAPV